jgi:restriction system protein
MASPEYGIWAITDKGRARLAAGSRNSGEIAGPINLVALHEEYISQFRDNLRERLIGLTPEQFEHFAKKLLVAYGFVDMKVTSTSRDGGIDGHGMLKVGLARMGVAFQCKRWQKSVQRPEVDKFRGAIQGEFEQGMIEKQFGVRRKPLELYSEEIDRLFVEIE